MTQVSTTQAPLATVEPTPFQKEILVRAAASANWLVRSIEACDGKGSAAFYSRTYHPLRGWAWPYPETTGYIIETLIEYAKFSGSASYAELAVRQADWIMTLQSKDGALPGGAVVRGKEEEPSIFNTGQMILGLVAASDHSGDQKYLSGASRAASWLAGEVDTNAGTWTRHAYVNGFSPAYYTRVAWPVLEVFARTNQNALRDAAVRVLETIASWQLPNGSIRNWGFEPDRPAFTHTIAYTLRGFLESSRILDNERYEVVATKAAETLRRRVSLRGRLAGAYDLDLKGSYWYTCLTGNCQLAIIWIKLFDRTRDIRFLNAAIKAVQFVMARQRMHSLDPNVRGAIAGSSPFWGRYLTLRYPNWASKFYLDALMMIYARLQYLLETGPCALW